MHMNLLFWIFRLKYELHQLSESVPAVQVCPPYGVFSGYYKLCGAVQFDSNRFFIRKPAYTTTDNKAEWLSLVEKQRELCVKARHHIRIS